MRISVKLNRDMWKCFFQQLFRIIGENVVVKIWDEHLKSVGYISCGIFSDLLDVIGIRSANAESEDENSAIIDSVDHVRGSAEISRLF